MKKFISNNLVLSTLVIVLVFLTIKWLILTNLNYGDYKLTGLLEISEITIVFTGAFFVIAFILSGTLTDFKESEKLPGEIAANLEAIQDALLLGLNGKATHNLIINENSNDLKNHLKNVSNEIVFWISSSEKDSHIIYTTIRKLNVLVYDLSKEGMDKDCIKAIQDNINMLRKNITRIYIISRTDFILPAYKLAQSILFIIIILLSITKFKTPTADITVCSSLIFVFVYLYFLIHSLDDPFDPNSKIKISLLPIDRFITRIDSSF